MSLMMWLRTNNRLAFCHALAWLLLLGGSHQVYAVDIPTQDGVKAIEAVKKSSWDKSGIDWLQWVVVDTQPATIAHGELMSDPEKLAFIAEFDPDMFDWWSGALMNRAYIATMRGIAADCSIEYEYESGLHGVKHFEKEIYGGNGPGATEKGQRPRNNYGDFDMTHLAPKWHETVKNGIMRLALHGDMVCHDNLIQGLHYQYAHFDDWSNRRFVAYMQKRFSDDALRQLGFIARSFHIRSYVREQRAAGRTNEMLIEDPIIHEFIRFYYVSLIGAVAEFAELVHQSPPNLTAPTAFYGNLGSMTQVRTPGLAYSEYVDMVWIERLESDQPCLMEDPNEKQARSSLMYKIAKAAGHFEKTVCTYQDPPLQDSRRLPAAIVAAEAYANGGLLVLASHFKKHGGYNGALYKAHAHHARFASAHREAFIDRRRVADVVVINSIPALFWRWFSSFEVDRPHLKQIEAVARLLEDHHVSYDALIFGHPDIYNDADHLARLKQYQTVVLPNVDAISDRQVAAVEQWVRAGGKLILWGENGTRDEELRPRSENAFAGLMEDPGQGRVVSTSSLGLLTHPKNGHSLDITEAYINHVEEAEARLAAVFVQERPLLKVDLPPTVWVNVWRHGGGPMITVQLVNYAIDLKADSVAPVKDFKVRVRIPAGASFAKATWSHTDYPAKDFRALPPVQELPMVVKDGYVEVTVPHLGVFGVLLLTAEGEGEARATAAQVRKWYQRLKIARRAPGQADAAEPGLPAEAESYLDGIQGDVQVKDFARLIEPGKRLATRLQANIARISAQVPAERTERLAATLAAEAVHKFDFGANAQAPPGWLPVGLDTDYSSERGYGWAAKGPLTVVGKAMSLNAAVYPELDAMHADYIRSKDPIDYIKKTTSNKYYPVVLPPANEAEFRVDLPNGDYIVTAVIGSPDESYNAFRVGITYIDAEGLPVVYGERLNSGVYQNRVFPVRVGDGHLDLRFRGRNVGPLYQNNCDWMINGLLIQKADQPLTAQAAEVLQRAKQHSATAIRKWKVLGPFLDEEWLGFEQTFGPEQSVDLNAEYQGAGKKLSWKVLKPLEGFAPYVSLNGMLNGRYTRGAGAFAAAEFDVEKAVDAVLSVSTTQYGEIYLNGKKVATDNLPAGLLGEELIIPVSLKKGANLIVIKTLNHWGDEWAVRASLTDHFGNPLRK